jgi:hypothetical protein
MDAPHTLYPNHLLSNRQAFASDPFGYASLAWSRWAFVQSLAGFDVDLEKPPTAEDLKSPVLWLSHARALSEAASAVLRHEPSYDAHPRELTGVCDSQYCAVGLMLVGYSLEVCLKAILIVRHGVQAYAAAETRHKHHQLEKLASFIPDLTDKDKAILRLLTHFLTWAGRYPDPGSGRASHAEDIFILSEQHKISARDVLSLAARVMQQSSVEIERAQLNPPSH